MPAVGALAGLGFPQRLAGGAVGQSALYQSLEAGDYWALDESGGARASAFNGQTLTSNNSVGSNAGLVYDTAAQFNVASTRYLSRASEERLQTGDMDYWLATWVRFDTAIDQWRPMCIKWTSTSNGEFLFDKERFTDQFRFQVYDNTVNRSVYAANFGSVVVGEWLFVLAWHDAANNRIGICVNNGTPNLNTYTGFAPTPSTAPFEVGGWTAVGRWMDGRMGPFYFGKGYVPTPGDRTFLYNSGNGRTLAQLAAYAG